MLASVDPSYPINIMNSDRFYSVLTKIWVSVEKFLAVFLKTYLNTLVGQGSLKKVINFAVDNLFEEVVNPFMEVALARAGYKYDFKNGKVLIEKLNKAKEENNEADYNSAVDDILGRV